MNERERGINMRITVKQLEERIKTINELTNNKYEIIASKTKVLINKLSTLSAIPPCPGSKFEKSFIP